MMLRLRFEDTSGNELLDDTDVEPTCPIPTPGDIVFLVETSFLVKHREFYYDNLGTPSEICTVVLYCESDYPRPDEQ